MSGRKARFFCKSDRLTGEGTLAAKEAEHNKVRKERRRKATPKERKNRGEMRKAFCYADCDTRERPLRHAGETAEKRGAICDVRTMRRAGETAGGTRWKRHGWSLI